MTSKRQRVACGSPFEPRYGYCRAVRIGKRVAGTHDVPLAGLPGRPNPVAAEEACA